MPDAEYLSTSVKINLDEYVFSARGREIVFDGYTKISGTASKDPDEAILPPLAEGDILNLEQLNLDQKYTKPPARFLI